VKTIAVDGTGIEDIITRTSDHRHYLEHSGELSAQRRQKLMRKYRRVVEDAVLQAFWTSDRNEQFEAGFDQQLPPYRISQRLIKSVIREAKSAADRKKQSQ
jgi:putative protein kinase ArgK-like GTPase of G3E family